jgi:hypothetical protein
MIIHQCISGFTQNVHTLHGVLKLSERFRQSALIDGVNTRVALHQWKSDWAKVAEYYWLLTEYYMVPVTICVYAYSWGAGWGAMQLARHLNRAGLDIKAMVLCDPVYRHPKWYLRWMSLVQRDSSFSPIIRVPTNIHTIYTLNQQTNRPMGHRLLATNGTVIHPPYHVKNTIHQKMDDSWKFHALSLEVAKRVTTNQPLGQIDVEALKLGDYLLE